MSSVDTTPPDPAAPEFFIELAARDTPAALTALGNETRFGALDPGPGHRIVLAQRLVEVLSHGGHSRAAAAWAVHRLVQRGLLVAEVAARVERPVAGYRPDAERTIVAGDSVRESVTPAGRPVPYDRLLVRSTPALWEWRPGECDPAGPLFAEADFDRALASLDLVLQDYDWQPGDNRFFPDSLDRALHRGGITSALIRALFLRLVDRGVFRPWFQTSPAGYSCDPTGPRPLYRTLSKTIYRLVTTRERWYSYPAIKRSTAFTGLPPGTAGEAPHSAASPPPGRRGAKAVQSGRDRKQEARDAWIYRQCCKGRAMPYGRIVAELRRVAASRGWHIVSSPERIRQIGEAYADRHGKPRPPRRQDL